MIFISCVSKLLYIVNISSYKKEQLKLHRSFLGVKGGGVGQKQPSEQPSLQHLAVTEKNETLGDGGGGG